MTLEEEIAEIIEIVYRLGELGLPENLILELRQWAMDKAVNQDGKRNRRNTDIPKE